MVPLRYDLDFVFFIIASLAERLICRTEAFSLGRELMPKVFWCLRSKELLDANIFILAKDIAPPHKNVAVGSKAMHVVDLYLHPDEGFLGVYVDFHEIRAQRVSKLRVAAQPPMRPFRRVLHAADDGIGIFVVPVHEVEALCGRTVDKGASIACFLLFR
jgi:hypothetical protein